MVSTPVLRFLFFRPDSSSKFSSTTSSSTSSFPLISSCSSISSSSTSSGSSSALLSFLEAALTFSANGLASLFGYYDTIGKLFRIVMFLFTDSLIILCTTVMGRKNTLFNFFVFFDQAGLLHLFLITFSFKFSIKDKAILLVPNSTSLFVVVVVVVSVEDEGEVVGLQLSHI
ncbi:hypothetical protein BpHYR1_048139 [Brachionus plicatilis]|uniref:Uncharacterized protein n=1 Tax=Brachionus plicatilis TaxID=10195 RepID=A0A3M7T079_BRAPC|nr:hypothetical protein BpHYR1_048139 [Brachionus plicatilis]